VTILRRLQWLLPLFFLISVSTRADSALVYFDGGYAFANNGYGIGPYTGTLDKTSALFYCVDFNHDIVGNSGWTATATDLNPSSSYAGTLLKDANTYSAMAWMITKMTDTSDQTLHADYQWAIWSLSVGSDPNAPLNPNALNAKLIGDAFAAVGNGWSANGWEILTPIYGTGGYNHPGYYGQEFMVHPVPEPSSILLVLAGLSVLALITLRK
jgi:hypothetical protein